MRWPHWPAERRVAKKAIPVAATKTITARWFRIRIWVFRSQKCHFGSLLMSTSRRLTNLHGMPRCIREDDGGETSQQLRGNAVEPGTAEYCAVWFAGVRLRIKSREFWKSIDIVFIKTMLFPGALGLTMLGLLLLQKQLANAG